MRTVARIALQAPLPWPQLLAYMRPRLIPGVERVDDGVFERRVAGVTVHALPDHRRDRLCIAADGTVDPERVVAAVARLFALDEDHATARAHLQSCPLLGPRLAASPGLRPLGCWDSFELCVRTVLGQQVTVAAAGTLMQRLVDRCGGAITPAAVLAADLSSMGMPGKRVQTLRGLAAAVDDGALRFDVPWPQVDAALQRLSGFGPWTRSYLAIRLGREPDAFPQSDVGLIRAADVDSPKALLQRAEAWRPYRSLAAIYLWMT